MSDYFDRLLARHAPGLREAVPLAPPGAGDGDAAAGTALGAVQPVRVRPRMPGPFERVEALRERAAQDDGLSPATPSAPPVSPVGTDEGAGALGVREIRTERHTVMRDAPAVPGEQREPEQPQQRPDSAPLRPAPRPLRPVAGAAVRRDGESSGRDGGPAVSGAAARGPVPALVAPGVDLGARSAVVRPGSDGLAAGRSARQQAAAARRGGTRPAERIVHVQIGRLEVSASTPPGAGGDGAGGPGRRQAGRTAPTVSLDDYLARGRNGERSN